MKKSDESLLLKAAQMLARGDSELQVAKACDRSRSWVQSIKRNPEFQKQVEELKKEKKQAVQQQIKEEIENFQQSDYTAELLEFRQQLVVANRVMFTTAGLLLKKLKQKIENLEINDIPSSKVSQMLKNAAESMNLGLEIGKSAVGIDELLEQLNDFETPSLKGYEATRGYQPFGENSIRN